MALAGILGGITGAYILAGIDGDVIKRFIVAYLACIGAWILWRAGHDIKPRRIRPALIVAPLRAIGGFFDAIGGGGWGPTVTSTLVRAGQEPRKAIRTVNTAEFFLTTAISATFVWSLVTGHWREAEDLRNHLTAVGGLVAGGLIAAPFAGLITKRVPARILAYAVGSVLVLLAIFQGLQLAGVLG